MAEPPEHQDAGGRGSTSGATSFRIFLNYRREDASGHAGRLYDFLLHGGSGGVSFRKEQIFMDIDTIAPGVDFRRVIEDAVGSCDVFISVIGRRWLDAADAEGGRRLDKGNDFVRLEIEAALTRDIPVVPVLVQGAEMPSAEELPEPLDDFAHRNAVELSDARWAYDVGRLTAWLKTAEEEKARREQAERERQEQEEAEQAERERLEKEAAERAERERLEREAVERAERERLEREAAERAERERLEREAAERAERERLEREATAQAAQPRPATAEPIRRWIRRLRQLKRRYRILIAGLLVGAAALGVVLAVSRSGEEAPAPYPTDAEQELLSHIPSGIAASCTRNDPGDDWVRAGVSCDAPSIRTSFVDYQLVEDMEAEADSLFFYCLLTPTAWEHGNICLDLHSTAGTSLYWTDNRFGISGQVEGTELSKEELRAEWECCLQLQDPPD